MIQALPCAYCNKTVIYDDGLDEHGNHIPLHPDATKYYRATPFEVYCDAACGLAKYEIDNGRQVPEFLNEIISIQN